MKLLANKFTYKDCMTIILADKVYKQEPQRKWLCFTQPPLHSLYVNFFWLVVSFILPYNLLVSGRNLFNEFFNTVDHKILAVETFGS